MVVLQASDSWRCGLVDSPGVKIARDQQARTGDLILSRRNDATLVIDPGTRPLPGAQVDQVRNGNRWRVMEVDAQRGRILAERLTDHARVIFGGDYLREHITLGYAGTVHSAQGITIGTSTQPGMCWTILSDRASRTMAYVGMTRGRDENHLAIYPAASNEAHEHHGDLAGIHQVHRGSKCAAAHYFRLIVANDERARTMHTVAARTDRALLPTSVAALLDRNDRRRTDRAHAWSAHTAQKPRPRSRLPTHQHQSTSRYAWTQPQPRPGIRSRTLKFQPPLRKAHEVGLPRAYFGISAANGPVPFSIRARATCAQR
jgi:hypothetical protein